MYWPSSLGIFQFEHQKDLVTEHYHCRTECANLKLCSSHLRFCSDSTSWVFWSGAIRANTVPRTTIWMEIQKFGSGDHHETSVWLWNIEAWVRISLAPRRFGGHLTAWPFGIRGRNFWICVISKHMLQIKFVRTFCDIALRWMLENTYDDKSTLVQVMVWCCQTPNHYLSQCWSRSMSQYGITRPQWVKCFKHTS